MKNGIDLSELYSLRKNFTVIGLTGRNGSGYTKIAELISKPFHSENYPNPTDFDLSLNSYKKYKITYNFAKENFLPYTLLRYKDIITLYLLKYPVEEFMSFLESEAIQVFFSKYRIKIDPNLKAELNAFESLIDLFRNFQNHFESLGHEKGIKTDEYAYTFCDFYFSTAFMNFSDKFHKTWQIESPAKHNLLMELFTNNIRKSGSPFSNSLTNRMHVFAISELMNSVIKAIRKKNKDNPTKIVIDSFRNPFEVMFFKQRYSAFYLMAVNRDDKIRERVLEHAYGKHYKESIAELLKDEYIGGKGKGFYRQYVRDCIEKADIHITFRSRDEAIKLNKNRNDGTSPYYSWQMQVLKYLTLIEHPGLITPSPEERCMQLAYTAKYNSGCISRQVGATITDADYSVKAIGWNSTPEGQTPCLLRNAEILINASDIQIRNELRKEKNNLNNQNERIDRVLDPELISFTPYEKQNSTFKTTLKEKYRDNIEANKEKLSGRNVCFCFKSLQNSCTEGKNQVHTRSLHAEESAFLQITKYGGTAIENGKLFTTASPCELCAKKAYQLGIKVIYYVDPYPGISQEQVLSVGNKKPEVRLFNGAIGNAYYWLYEPFMAYKDELSLILGLDIKDKLSQLEEVSQEKDRTIAQLQKELEEVKKHSNI